MRPDSYYDKVLAEYEAFGDKIEKATFSILKKLWDAILLGFGFGIGFLIIHIIAKYINIL
jgi:hypothetical protein